MHIGVGKRKAFAGQQSVPFSGRLPGSACIDTFLTDVFIGLFEFRFPRGIFLIRRSLLFIVSGLVGSPYRQQKGIFPDIAAVGLSGLFLFASFHGFVIVVADTSLQFIRNFTQLFGMVLIGSTMESSQLPLIAHRFQEPDIVPQCVDCFVDIAIAGSKGMDAIKIPKAKISSFPKTVPVGLIVRSLAEKLPGAVRAVCSHPLLSSSCSGTGGCGPKPAANICTAVR